MVTREPGVRLTRHSNGWNFTRLDSSRDFVRFPGQLGGLFSTMLAVKVKMRGDLNINDAVENINALERKLKERIPKLKWCFVEPDITD